MAKIQPLPASAGAASPSDEAACTTTTTYTVWMKSLVFNGNGCTVYGADGAVAFRVDNYGCRGGREACFFMDRAGKALIAVRRRGFGAFRRWEVSRCCHGAAGAEDEDETETAAPWFAVRRGKGGAPMVAMHGGAGPCYRVDAEGGKKEKKNKAGYRVVGAVDGAVAAEVARKTTAAGVPLGDDVLSLTVGPGTDRLLALGLVVVCGLMNRSM
ncbi:protein LURP-one-related 11 [Brachypodium distachyon]|uniref:Protein LURP-one-related 11 n=1 Tax=Brachypodium distachyon TaxID=15368 RepID=I1HUW1_BRADI|nr:protein LURP-one-related 11 [Brachypodium distachyon]KQK11369.1 hypothetical protein BRADI_2g59750v3 [Brachypodium distachyon]|eukprot:XP_010232782.1 protein LURP-one-related 11 [Brachypodium distachyon]